MNLTDEQLRWYAENNERLITTRLATELIALRADRAKPTQSDVGRAWEAIRLIRRMDFGAHNVNSDVPILAAFASIRAEGSAERAKLERVFQDASCNPLLADGTELDIATIDWLAACLRLAQPAESEATP